MLLTNNHAKGSGHWHRFKNAHEFDDTTTIITFNQLIKQTYLHGKAFMSLRIHRFGVVRTQQRELRAKLTMLLTSALEANYIKEHYGYIS